MFIDFDLNSVDAYEDYSALPDGDYSCAIANCEEKANSAGTGSFLLVALAVADGPFAGRKIFDRLSLKNPNPKAVNVARARLKSIVAAAGMASIRDTNELVNRLVTARVASEEWNGKTQNVVKSYLPAPMQSAPRPQAQRAARATRPW